MAIVRYDPFQVLNQLQGEINRIFDSRYAPLGEEGSRFGAGEWAPAVDIKEEESRFLIHADLPGVDPKDVELTLENGVLTIKGHRETEAREEREGYKRVERASGTFYRRFTLPDTADPDKVEAQCRNGVLEVSIHKREAAQPKRITVKVE